MTTEFDEAGIRITPLYAAECQYLEAMSHEGEMEIVRIINTEENGRGDGRTWHYLIKPKSNAVLIGIVSKVQHQST